MTRVMQTSCVWPSSSRYAIPCGLTGLQNSLIPLKFFWRETRADQTHGTGLLEDKIPTEELGSFMGAGHWREICAQGWFEEVQSVGLARHARKRVGVVFRLVRRKNFRRHRFNWPRRGLGPRASWRRLEAHPWLLPFGVPHPQLPVKPQRHPRSPCDPQSVGTVTANAGIEGEADAAA